MSREVTATTHDPMIAVDGTRKRYCPGCGLARQVSYAETVPCGACGSLGTQKTQVQFDPVTDEPVPPQPRQPKVRAQAPEPATDAPTEKPVHKPKPKPQPKPEPKPAQQAASTLMFF